MHVDLYVPRELAGGRVEDVGAAPAAVPVVGGAVLAADDDEGDACVVRDGADAEGGEGGVVFFDVGLDIAEDGFSAEGGVSFVLFCS